ncbi:hypothetical protein ABW19_dt0203903 [Dactylella cylindrospora]|nr:hypothetical protein ABW19_dt0203903 [Dactylella cylindrospora]
MGRSRSRSRQRGDYDDNESSRSRQSRQKSRDKSRSRSREREYETKEERKARRHRQREEKRRDSEESGRQPRGGYEEGYSGSKAGYDEYQSRYGSGGGAAPYPESPQETRAGYGGDYQQGNYPPADSYAQSGYAAGAGAGAAPYPTHTGSTDYGSPQGYPTYSQGHDAEPYPPSHDTQSYGAPHETATYYGHQSPPPAQYGDSTYGAAPQAPYPTTQYPEDTTHSSTYYPPPEDTTTHSSTYYPPPATAPYPHEETSYAPPPPHPSEVPHGYGSPQPGYHDSSYGGSGYTAPPTSGYDEVPRNPSSHPTYHPRPEPSGPPPEAEAEFQMNIPQSEEKWQPTAQQEKKSIFSSFSGTLHDVVRDIASSSGIRTHHTNHDGGTCTDPNHYRSTNRFSSFASPRNGNRIKWFVDGKDYCWAVAEAIAHARESIWILDWWLSPELHLRRPGAKYEEFRLDKMLKAAAEKGVKVNIIVYKEVTQALTLSSAHTKHFLEESHPNIAVFRHPDHTADPKVLASKLATGDIMATIGKLTGADDGIVLYWAHHEKLCLIDGTVPGGGIAFMGGLDLCWGRWDLPHHPISDVHPTDVKQTLFLGQDYNNARVMDFHTVDHWEQNKLRRTESSRMGWSDVALCFTGPTVEDLKYHFVERWNFIWREKYYSRPDPRYLELKVEIIPGESGFEHGRIHIGAAASKIKTGMKGLIGRGGGRGGQSRRRDDGEYDDPLAFGGDSDEEREERRRKKDKRRGRHDSPDPAPPGAFPGYAGTHPEIPQELQEPAHPMHGAKCQIVRSCTEWSNGTKTEHSVQNAYIQIINSARHFIYIENQFFITASGGEGGWPVKNRIGEALVNRIVRAHEAGEKFRVIVIMPSVPAFAGNLKDDASLGTRAIMEFQYDSISRGGKGRSIYERLNAKGINPLDYIRFFNLRNYDRINISRELESAEAQTKLEYEVIQQALENQIGAGWSTAQTHGGELDQWGRVQGNVGAGVWDSVAQCSMLGGGDVRDAPWSGDPEKEIDAFVSEELYIHSKVLIADDNIVICGSANLNDRSQNGDHDSEIAIIVEDHTPLGSLMNGRPYVASHFAATLRRYLFRKHLGLIPAQASDYLDPNMLPVPEPNVYDFDSEEDKLVMDPLSDNFWNFWNATAKRNTEAFDKVFHAVPTDNVLNWEDYDKYFGQYFHPSGTKENPIPPKYPWGHVVKDNFPPGSEGARAVKSELARIRGSLVEMSLKFMQNVDFAVEAASFNAITEAVYI